MWIRSYSFPSSVVPEMSDPTQAVERYEHHAGGEFPKQLLGSSREVDKEFPMLWKIEFIAVILGFLDDWQPCALSE